MHPACINIFSHPSRAHYNNIPHSGGCLQMGVFRNLEGVADMARGQLLDDQRPWFLGCQIAEGA